MFALFSRILKLSGRYKGRIQGAFVCAFLESILSKMPIFLAFVILSGFAAGTLTGQTCLYVGLGLAAAVLVQMLVHYLSDSLQSAAGYLMFADKRMELGGHLRKLPMGYFTSGNIGKISSVLSTDMVFIEEVAMSTLGNMMSYLLSSLVLLAFMFYLNWQLGLIAAIVTILAWLVSKKMNKVSLREAASRQEQSERLTDAVLSFVEGIGVIKSYNLLGEKSKELTNNFKRSCDFSINFEKKMTPWTTGLNVLYAIGISALFCLSIFLQQNGSLSLAYVLGILLFVFDLFGPLKALYGEATRLTVMNAALDRIEAVLEEPELPDTGKQHIPVQTQPGQSEVQFSDVAFAYQDKEVLHHINFSMRKNSMTALVGPSGGGKSTIANLLARLWDVKSGSVTIRGVDIRNVPLSELMDQISMVSIRHDAHNLGIACPFIGEIFNAFASRYSLWNTRSVGIDTICWDFAADAAPIVIIVVGVNQGSDPPVNGQIRKLLTAVVNINFTEGFFHGRRSEGPCRQYANGHNQGHKHCNQSFFHEQPP